MTLVASKTARAQAERRLEAETAEAWHDYLERTRAQPETRYDEIEPWAWSLLQQRLRQLAARRARLR